MNNTDTNHIILHSLYQQILSQIPTTLYTDIKAYPTTIKHIEITYKSHNIAIRAGSQNIIALYIKIHNMAISIITAPIDFLANCSKPTYISLHDPDYEQKAINEVKTILERECWLFNN